MMRTAVLFLVFNRPDTTRRVFATIRSARPPRLYIAADGPRVDRTGEMELCEEVRHIATAVDWSCEVKTLFRDSNLGCKHAVSEGISWFFEQEDEGIILEDDIMPAASFFPYCEELLISKRYDTRVGAICGFNSVDDRYVPRSSYFLSKYMRVWGWAGWKRTWEGYSANVESLPLDCILSVYSRHRLLVKSYWRNMYRQVARGTVDTWDYQLQFLLWMRKQLVVAPSRNMTSNIGVLGCHSTEAHFNHFRPVHEVGFPLIEPSETDADDTADRFIEKYSLEIGWINFLEIKLRNIVRNIQYLAILMMNMKVSIHMQDFFYVDERVTIMTGEDARQALLKNSDSPYLSDDNGVTSVPIDRWRVAQVFEHTGWMTKWNRAEDDRNYQHMVAFDHYQMLRGTVWTNAIELGCGPFTNLRLIGTVCEIKECALLDPLIMSYLKHRNCRYDQKLLRCDSNLSLRFNSVRAFRVMRRLIPKAVSSVSSRKNIHISKLIACPIEEMPTSERYDLIVIINVIEHCYNIDLIFENILKIAAPNAILVFHDRCYDHQQVKDLLKGHLYDAGHPLRVDRKIIDSFLEMNFKVMHKKIIDQDVNTSNVAQEFKDLYYIGRLRSGN